MRSSTSAVLPGRASRVLPSQEGALPVGIGGFEDEAPDGVVEGVFVSPPQPSVASNSEKGMNQRMDSSFFLGEGDRPYRVRAWGGEEERVTVDARTEDRMLAFTGAGVVSSPSAVQIRMGARFPGRLAARAPDPSRRMTDAEVLDTLRHFTDGLRGPRTRPCTRLVLSGLDADRLAHLPAILQAARRQGFDHVVLHGGTTPIPDGLDVDVVVLRAGTTAPTGIARTWVVELGQGTLAAVEAEAEALLADGERVVLTWPWSDDARAAAPHEVRAMVERLPRGTGTLHLRGLPACLVGDLSPRRAANRWYVDADHQGAAALLFFPDVLRFAKRDSCRFCSFDERCDGVAYHWLERLAPGMLPLD